MESCGCQPCTTFVAFVILLTDIEGKAVSLANVSLADGNSFMSDDEGMVGFMIFSQIELVRVSVAAVGYAPFVRVYTVVPGEANVVTVPLLRTLTTLLLVPLRPSLPPAINLADHFLTSSTLLGLDPVVGRSNEVSLFVILPPELWRSLNPLEALTMLSMDLSIYPLTSIHVDALGVSLMTGTNSSRMRRDADFHDASDSREDDEWGENFPVPNRRERASSARGMLMVFAMGTFDVLDSDGMSVHYVGNQPFTVSAVIDKVNISEAVVSRLQLYILDQAMQEFHPDNAIRLDNATLSVSSNESHYLLQFHVFNVNLPLFFAIGYEDNHLCYIAVRFFDPNLGDLEIISRFDVMVTSDDGMSVQSGLSNECLPIPCRGAITVRPSSSLYTPNIYTSDDIEAMLWQPTSPVYTRRHNCTTLGLEGTVDQNFFRFERNVAAFPQPNMDLFPSENASDLTTPPFCFARVEVVGCFGATVMVASQNELGEERAQEVILGEGWEGPGLDGSTFLCDYRAMVCLQVSCDLQTNVSAEVISDGEPCTPWEVSLSTSTRPVLHNSAPVGSDIFSFDLDPQNRAHGIYSDSEYEVAFYMCMMGSTVGIISQCFTRGQTDG